MEEAWTMEQFGKKREKLPSVSRLGIGGLEEKTSSPRGIGLEVPYSHIYSMHT